jgi:hypothetical protein
MGRTMGHVRLESARTKLVSRLSRVAYSALTILALVTGIVVGYNQLRIWQHGGESYMRELAHIVLIFACAGIAIGSGAAPFLVAARISRNRLPEMPGENGSDKWKTKWYWKMKFQWADRERIKLQAELQAKAAHPQDKLLSPLQVNILVLSREIRTFLQEKNPAPELSNYGPPRGDIATEMAKINAETDSWHVAYGQWARKRLYGYETRYLGRVKEIAGEIGAQSGMVVAHLMEYVNNVEPLMDFDALPDLLSEFVAKLEKPEERRRLEEERKMQQARALLANAPTGPPKVESPQELRRGKDSQ